MLDVDPVVQSNALAFPFRTSFDPGDTLIPLNNLNAANWGNVFQEGSTAVLIIAGFAAYFRFILVF